MRELREHRRALLLLLLVTALCCGHGDAQCRTITNTNMACVVEPVEPDAVNCNFVMRIYEDCAIGSTLLTFEETGFDVGCDAFQLIGGNSVGLKSALDAESNPSIDCPTFITQEGVGDVYVVVSVEDVNEKAPFIDVGTTLQVNINEANPPNQELLTFGVSDPDSGELPSLNFTYGPEAIKSKFALTKGACTASLCSFTFTVLQSLDYEAGMFYELNAQFTTGDSRGNKSSVDMKILVFVEDQPDSAPFWTWTVPSASVNESEEVVDVFYVEARDRDTSINNAIKYQIIAGNNLGLFFIDPDTGYVTTTKAIDRETLASTFFNLEIQAKEVLEDGSDAPEPSKVSQVTIIQILDVNDNTPSFSEVQVTMSIDEMIEDNNPEGSSITVTLQDLDQGTSGEYTIVSNDAAHLSVSPSSGSGNTSIKIRTVYVADDNVFDSEGPDGVKEMSFTVTATEVADASHKSELKVTVTFKDVNDNSPEFSVPEDYVETIGEGTDPGVEVITVAATDKDVTDQYGTKSIRYSLLDCISDLAIDETSGVVTTARRPDYEATQELYCKVQASDEDGAGLSTIKRLNVTISDVNDTPPTLNAAAPAEVLEDEPVGHVVLTITAVDPDTTADVEFTLQYGDGIDAAVKGWFNINMTSCDNGVAGVCGDVTVANSLDREKLSQPFQVVLTVLATDKASETAQTDTVDVTITILDVNDVAPSFCTDCIVGLSVLEDARNDTAIARITASDPDEEDQGTLTFSCSDNEKVDINPTTGVLFVVNGKAIDREKEAEFTVILNVTDMANHSSQVEVTLTVLDINDNPPVLDLVLCNGPYTVNENETTGYPVMQLNATDLDQGAHRNLTYVLQNDIITTGVNPYTPFAVSSSGLVTVYENLSILKELDRESYASWVLRIRVYDGCENEEFTCQSQRGECEMSITVGDINDEPPELLKPLTLYAGEELLMGSLVPGPEITAFDGDLINTTATEIHYTVVGFQDEAGQDQDIPFEAMDFNEPNFQQLMEWSCRLYTTKNLANMTGSYTLLINATDGTLDDPVNTATLAVKVVITDANDNSPVIVQDECLLEYDRIVTIPEDTYRASSAIPCQEGLKPPNDRLLLTYSDLDADSPNNAAVIVIDYDNSKVEPASLYPGQLQSFELVQIGQEFALYLKKDMIGNLSLEQGKSYNLSIVATDLGNPPLSSSPDWIFVNLTDNNEYKPHFCQDVENCVATTYITERTQNHGLFPAAADKDNAGNYTFDTIYYYVIYDPSGFFKIPSGSEELHQLSPIRQLDREEKGFYTVLVQATNSRVPPKLVTSGDPVSTDMLQINVTIIDVNDNPPSFNSSVIFGSVLQSGSVGQEAVVIKALDPDLNETLLYSFDGDFQWEPQGGYGAEVFRISNDGVVGTVQLASTPSGLKGYCIVPVIVFDKMATGEHNATVIMQIFIVESSDQVPFYFMNDIETLENDKENIDIILTAAFKHEAYIDSMTPTSGTDNSTLDSVLAVHFVNTSTSIRTSAAPGNLVPRSVITSMAASGRLSTELQQQLGQLGLRLYRIGDSVVVDDQSLEQQLLTYQIVLGVVAMLLGSLVFLMLAAYNVRTRKLERRIKVLSTNTFGSKASDLDKAGLHMDVIPNSNLFKGEGANPMFNTSFKEFDRQDSGSLSSGDSVLVGVEDNPEFRDYAGGVRPSLGHSKDDSAFVGTGGMTSSNPLFANLYKKSEGGDKDSIVGGSDSSDDTVSQEAGDLGVPNSNFIFM